MEGSLFRFQIFSEVSDLMPCQLDGTCWEFMDEWIFWSRRSNDELEYQRRTIPLMVAAATYSVVPSKRVAKEEIKTWLENYCQRYSPCLVQIWMPIEVNGSTFLSVADQPFAFHWGCHKGLCSYRRLCLDTLIPINIGPVGRVFKSGLPEYNLDLRSYSAGEFPLVEHAIQLGIRGCFEVPWVTNDYQDCLGVVEVSSTTDRPFVLNPSTFPWLKEEVPELDQIKAGLYVVLERHCLHFAQIWCPHSLRNFLISNYRSYKDSKYNEFANASVGCCTRRGKAVLGRAFSSQESCFCKDVTLLSLAEYPLVPIARKASLTRCFAICLRSKCVTDFVCVVECFLPRDGMVDRDLEAFLNNLLSTMKDEFPGFIVASGKELGQRMKVEVVKVSPCDELDSFKIGQTRVQSLQDGGEIIDVDSLCQQSNLQNVTTAQLIPSCSSHRFDTFNCEQQVQVDKLVPHPIEEAMTNRGAVNVEVAHDGHIEFEKDTSEMMQLDSHFEQPNVDNGSRGNARSNDKVEEGESTRCGRQLVEAVAVNRESNFVSGAANNIEKMDSQKKHEIERIVKDYGITCEILEQHFGMLRKDAAVALRVSVPTLKRICRTYDIFRWPHHKTRKKVFQHTSRGVSSQGAEPFEGLDLSQEKGTDSLPDKRPPATSVMTIKVTHRDDIIKFKLTPAATTIDLQGEVERRLDISLEKFTIKYQDEDDEWITIATDSDLRDGMDELRNLKRTSMRLLVTPKS